MFRPRLATVDTCREMVQDIRDQLRDVECTCGTLLALEGHGIMVLCFVTKKGVVTYFPVSGVVSFVCSECGKWMSSDTARGETVAGQDYPLEEPHTPGWGRRDR